MQTEVLQRDAQALSSIILASLDLDGHLFQHAARADEVINVECVTCIVASSQ